MLTRFKDEVWRNDGKRLYKEVNFKKCINKNNIDEVNINLTYRYFINGNKTILM
jgi:hypothetical protein